MRILDPKERQSLPRVTEVKRTLSGRETRFECAILKHDGPHVVVLFVAPRAMCVHGVDLPAGTVTFGHFWTDRPYNVYHWLDPVSGLTIGYYVNLSDSTRMADGYLEWRDLIIDVLLLPNGCVAVLDADEVPADAPAALVLKIADVQSAILRGSDSLIAELEHHRAALWPPPPAEMRSRP
jgi:Protein of unknown function (DUF402)